MNLIVMFFVLLVALIALNVNGNYTCK